MAFERASEWLQDPKVWYSYVNKWRFYRSECNGKNDFFLYFNHYFPDSSSKYENMFKIFSSSYEHRRPLQYLRLTDSNLPNR